MSQRIAVVCVLAIGFASLLDTSCGGGGSKTPTGPTQSVPRTATLTFHVYDSARGEVPGATFSTTIQTDPTSGAFPVVPISLASLSLTGVDANRAVLRTPHVGDRVGTLLAKTLNGTISVQPTNTMAYDLFLMSTAAGADYACLDYTAEAVHGAASAFPELHRMTTGTIFNCPVQDGPDEPIQVAVGQFNEALNPYGIQYGHIDYRGADGGFGVMFVGWSDRATCSAAMGGGGWLVVRFDSADPPVNRAVWMIHEMAHAYLGAPDYYQNRGCFSGNVSDAFLDTELRGFLSWEFSERGKDAARYWALMDSRTRGASFSTR